MTKVRVRTNGHLTAMHDLGAGRAVLLVHGTAPGVSGWANWHSLAPILAADHRVLAPDLLGFGDSDKPTDVVYDALIWSGQLTALLDQIGIERVSVVGNSTGARIALQMAVDRPSLVDRLVLMSTRLHPSRSRAQDLLQAYVPDRTAMRTLLTECFASAGEPLPAELVEQRYQVSALPGAHQAMQSFFTTGSRLPPVPAESLRTINNPTLVMHGREDRVVPFPDSVELAQLMPAADLLIFAGTGHWFATERAGLVNTVIAHFLRDEANAA
jgi:pimeloyl-ACP methyl ester carboxylesterase